MIIRNAIWLLRRIRWVSGSVWGRLVLRSYGVEFGEGLRIRSAPVIQRHKTATIRLGRNVTILNELAENHAGITHPTVLCACQPGAMLVVGNEVGISGAILYAWQRIEIGDRVCVGVGVAIYDTDFHPLNAQARQDNYLSEVAVAPVVIEPDVWLGARAMVLKGVTIGRGAVIGAGAVVTRDIPAGTIAAGVPARVVGRVPNPCPATPRA